MKKSLLAVGFSLLVGTSGFSQGTPHIKMTQSAVEIIEALDRMVNTGTQPNGTTIVNNQGSINATVEVGRSQGSGKDFTSQVAYADMYTVDHRDWRLANQGSFGAPCDGLISSLSNFTLAVGRWKKTSASSTYAEPSYCRLIWSYDPHHPTNQTCCGGYLDAFNYYFGGGGMTAPLAPVGHHNSPLRNASCSYKPYNHSYNLWLYDMNGNNVPWTEIQDIISYGMVAQPSDLPTSCVNCGNGSNRMTLQGNYGVKNYADGILLTVQKYDGTILDVSILNSPYGDFDWKIILPPCGGTVDCNYLSTLHEHSNAGIVHFVAPHDGWNGYDISYYNWEVNGVSYRTTNNVLSVSCHSHAGGMATGTVEFEIDMGSCYLPSDSLTEEVYIPHPHCTPPPPPVAPPSTNNGGSPNQGAPAAPGTTSISDQTFEGEEFQVYPNPAHGQFTIESPDGMEYSYHLIDQNGRVIQSSIDVNERLHEVSTENLRTGVYTVRIQSNGRSAIRKVVVE
ncbi:T9SS type A sorting domain-containing protein [bacterium SCSIO 12741]|nr:T9SS type A sorting domain-containing protein [bacterium SCSIO 12741]